MVTQQCTHISLQSKVTLIIIDFCLTDKRTSTPLIQGHYNKVKHGGTKYHMAVPALIPPPHILVINLTPCSRRTALAEPA